ncbi:hypothetical protein DHEL01_v208887 [Diaporthe helianthi]|uniref:RNA polymerase II subunit B1 CTD phosphatase RPAP2 homolog n=1 Tax=Diaporthe helianthi TaxID=158607 RepID=A0A2P5HR31_DIAHE|nr:hypothetical protein DHEL01_v208887 [Diaporthe helianthi]
MASKTDPPIKGILKKPKTSSPSPTQPISTAATPSKARGKAPQPPGQDPRQIALQHARILQDRKDAEAQILEHVITLLDFPRNRSAPASDPDPADARDFAGLVRIFQPSDYDDLITERNLDGDKCGYVLCGNTRRRYKGAGTYKLVNKGRRDFDIVETRELEKWCSAGCARRALWVKVQLNETAAWERVGLPDIGIELYPEGEEAGSGEAAKGVGGSDNSAAEQTSGEAKKSEPKRLAAEMSRLQLREDRKAAEDAKNLALERGEDAKAAPPRSKVDVVVREKTVTTQAEAPALGDGADDSIEGYKVKFSTEPEKAS